MTGRLTVAGVPHDVGFATKPALAQSLITEAVNASTYSGIFSLTIG
jgi:hypothetical protein